MLHLNINNFNIYSICITCACFDFVISNFIAVFLKPKVHKLWLNVLIILLFFISTVLCVNYLDSLNRFLLLALLIVLYAYLRFQNTISKIWIITIHALFIELSCKTVISIIFMRYSNYAYEPLIYIISLVIFLFISFWCKNRLLFLQHDRISMKYVFMFSIVPFISILIINNIFLLNIKYDRMNYIYSLVSILLFLILNYVVFKLFDVFISESKTQQLLTIYEEQLKLYNEYTMDKEQSMKDLQTLKHDLLNRFLLLKSILSSGDVEQADDYISNLIFITSSVDTKIKCGNIAIDTILNYKEMMGEKEKITFVYELEVPVQIPFDMADICILLGNALDNAIEANKNKNIKDKYIKVFMKYVQHNLLIQIINPYDGNLTYASSGNLVTTKAHPSYHGFGIDSMKQVIDKYHGSLHIVTENNVFDLQILLLQEEEAR